MLRNLPALWKLYKGFQGLPTQTQGKQSNEEGKRQISHSNYSRQERRNEKNLKQEEISRPSIPKIYQPPFDYFE